MEQIADQLALLENAELVHRLADADLAYVFKHALTQQSAYEMLLLKNRHDIHRRVADAYVELYPGRLDENAALLAWHYGHAGDHAQTFAYALRAGDAAARVFANTEASSHYSLALEALAKLPVSVERQQRYVDTVVKQVSVSLRAVGPAESLRRLAQAETLARAWAEGKGATRQDHLRLARVQYWQGHALIHQNQPRAAIQQMRRVLEVARAENDPQLLAIPASIIGRSLLAQGQFVQAVPVLSDAVTALEQVRDEHEYVLATGFRALAMAILGDYAGGIEEAERALAYATQRNTLTGIAFGHGAIGMVQFFGNAKDRGITHAQASIETTAQSGDRLYAYVAFSFIGWAHARAGRCRESEESFERAQAIAQEIGGLLFFADWFAAARAERALRCGQVEHALDLAAKVAESARSSSGLFAEGLAERIHGQALAALQPARLEEAEAHLASSLARLEAGGGRLEAARTRIAWSRVLGQRGNAQAAQEQLERAAAQFAASGLTGELEEVRPLMARVPE